MQSKCWGPDVATVRVNCTLTISPLLVRKLLFALNQTVRQTSLTVSSDCAHAWPNDTAIAAMVPKRYSLVDGRFGSFRLLGDTTNDVK